MVLDATPYLLINAYVVICLFSIVVHNGSYDIRMIIFPFLYSLSCELFLLHIPTNVGILKEKGEIYIMENTYTINTTCTNK